MAYTRKNWKAFPDTTTPITAENLNHMDKGIADNDVAITNLTDKVDAENIPSTLGDTVGGAINSLNESLPVFKVIKASKTFAANISGYLSAADAIGGVNYDYVIPLGIYTSIANSTSATVLNTKTDTIGKSLYYNISNGGTQQTITGYWLCINYTSL